VPKGGRHFQSKRLDLVLKHIRHEEDVVEYVLKPTRENAVHDALANHNVRFS